MAALELVHRELGHHDATARTLQTLAVLVHAEDAHLAVFATESLQALESLLTVVQAGGGHVDVDGGFGANLKLAPFAVAEIATDIVIRWIITECQICPINVLHNVL